MQARAFLSLIVALCAAGPGRAQSIVYVLGSGEATGADAFGRSAAGAGDVDADGFPDVIVGAPFDDANGTSSGTVWVYSGRTGAVIWARSGQAAGDFFGWSVDGVGDTNGDGHSEVIIGAPLRDHFGYTNNGTAYLYSGATGTTIQIFSISQNGCQVGRVVRGLGDINGDNRPDFALGIPDYDSGSYDAAGRVEIRSGSNHQLIGSLDGNGPHRALGYSVDAVLAAGSTAQSRIVVGAPGILATEQGMVQLLDGYGASLVNLVGSAGNKLGASVAGVGDYDGDGTPDFAAGEPGQDLTGTDAGGVWILSGSSFLVVDAIYGPVPGEQFGTKLASLGQFDGSGPLDFLVGTPASDAGGVESGEVRAIQGGTCATLAIWTGSAHDHLGGAVGAADFNLDGFADVVMGAAEAAGTAGRVQIALAQSPLATAYCTAKLNSQGCTPAVSSSGVASLSIADNFHARASSLLNQKNGLLFWSLAPASIPFQGAILCVQPPHHRTGVFNSGGSPSGSDCTGTFDFHFSHAYVQSEGLVAGTQVHAQFWSRDPGFAPPQDFNLTDALAFQVVP